MLKGFTKNGEMINVILNEDGSVPVGMSGNMNTEVVNDEPIDVNISNNEPVPVSIDDDVEIKVTQTSDKEVTLNSSIQTLSTTATTIAINNKVTLIMIANYSEEADVTIAVGNKTYQVGASLALELPMNEEITSLSLTATAADTKVQLVVKGVDISD